MRFSSALVLGIFGLLAASSDASAKSREKIDMLGMREAREPARLSSGDNSRGLYVRGQTAGRADFSTLLDRMSARGIDTVVLDAKDYDGLLTYPSKVPLALDGGAVMKNPPIKDLGAKI